jgi:hypothetical protein
MKELSYKNVPIVLTQYYNMLMDHQSTNQQHFISPFAKADTLKDSLINKNIE